MGDALLELIKEDVFEREDQLTVDTGTAKKQVFVNRRIVNEQGVPMVEHNTDAAQTRVQLADVPATPSYRAEQFAQMSEVTKSLPPELQALVTPFLIETSDMPKRKEIAKLLRTKLGIDGDPDSPEAQQQQQQAQAQQQAEAQQLAKKFDADLAEQQARTAKLQAETQAIATAPAPAEAPAQPPDLTPVDVARVKAEADIEIARIKAQAEQGGVREDFRRLASELDERLKDLREESAEKAAKAA